GAASAVLVAAVVVGAASAVLVAAAGTVRTTVCEAGCALPPPRVSRTAATPPTATTAMPTASSTHGLRRPCDFGSGGTPPGASAVVERATGAPQVPQNVTPGWISVPQLPQNVA